MSASALPAVAPFTGAAGLATTHPRDDAAPVQVSVWSAVASPKASSVSKALAVAPSPVIALDPRHTLFAVSATPTEQSVPPAAPSLRVTGVLAALSNVQTPVALTGSVVTGDEKPDAHEPITVPGLDVVQTT